MARPETPEQLAAFESWYANKRQFRTISENLGIKSSTIYGWADRYDWESRASERDRKAIAKMEPRAIDRTVKFLEEQQKAGALLRARGIEYMASNKITDGRTAIAAIKEGVVIERQAIGLPDYVTQILNASADQLDTIVIDMERRRRESLSDSEGATEGIAAAILPIAAQAES